MCSRSGTIEVYRLPRKKCEVYLRRLHWRQAAGGQFEDAESGKANGSTISGVDAGINFGEVDRTNL
jgi:hypothetical protein